MPEKSLPLSNLMVLDLTRVRSGPTCVRQLADWGADVIKVEMPTEEGQEEAFVGDRHNPDFQNLHRNKRSITLNLKNKAGLEVFRKLVAKADVVVENYRPDVKNRLGIDYDSLKAINPRIVLGSISGFGQDGPYEKRPGFDQILQGMGGLMSVTGLPGQGPVRAGTAISDLTAGLYLSFGLMVALHEREISGEGQWVQSSLLEAQIAIMDFQAARWLMAKDVPQQAGNFHPTGATTGVYPTTDGHMNIAASGSEIWVRLCKVLEAEHFLDHPDYATSDGRLAHRDQLFNEMCEITRTRSSDDWVQLMNDGGVPCGPIYSMDQVFEDPQVKHLGMAAPVHHPELGDIELVGQPIKLNRTPSEMRTVTPAQGEHTDTVLGELGYDADAIAALRSEKAI